MTDANANPDTLTAQQEPTVIGRDTQKVVAQMRKYVHQNDDGSECRANGHTLTMWANTIEQEQQRLRLLLNDVRDFVGTDRDNPQAFALYERLRAATPR